MRQKSFPHNGKTPFLLMSYHYEGGIYSRYFCCALYKPVSELEIGEYAALRFIMVIGSSASRCHVTGVKLQALKRMDGW